MKKYQVGNIKFSFEYNYDHYFKNNIENYEINSNEEVNHHLKVIIKNDIIYPTGVSIGNNNPYIILNEEEKIIYFEQNNNIKILIKHDYKFKNINIFINNTYISDLIQTEYVLSGLMFLELLMYKGYLPIHATALKINGEAILFSGPSGIGKSTHRTHWLNTFNDVLVINDDKPILDFSNPNYIDVIGSPFSGEHTKNHNIKAPLKAIVLLSQGLDNKIEVIDNDKIIPELIRNILRPQTEDAWDMILPLIERIYEDILVIKLSATNDTNSVKAVYNYLFGRN